MADNVVPFHCGSEQEGVFTLDVEVKVDLEP